MAVVDMSIVVSKAVDCIDVAFVVGAGVDLLDCVVASAVVS